MFNLAAINIADLPPPAIEIQADAPLPTAAGAPTLVALAADDCDLTATVQQAIRDDAPTRAALSALPVSARSVANAVMLWDGHWVDASTPEARLALAQVRALVSGTVESASPACRVAVQAGPRLIVLPGSPDIVLALGSGRWRWGDLAPADPSQFNSNPTIQTGSD